MNVISTVVLNVSKKVDDNRSIPLIYAHCHSAQVYGTERTHGCSTRFILRSMDLNVYPCSNQHPPTATYLENFSISRSIFRLPSPSHEWSFQGRRCSQSHPILLQSAEVGADTLLCARNRILTIAPSDNMTIPLISSPHFSLRTRVLPTLPYGPSISNWHASRMPPPPPQSAVCAINSGATQSPPPSPRNPSLSPSRPSSPPSSLPSPLITVPR